MSYLSSFAQCDSTDLDVPPPPFTVRNNGCFTSLCSFCVSFVMFCPLEVAGRLFVVTRCLFVITFFLPLVICESLWAFALLCSCFQSPWVAFSRRGPGGPRALRALSELLPRLHRGNKTRVFQFQRERLALSDSSYWSLQLTELYRFNPPILTSENLCEGIYFVDGKKNSNRHSNVVLRRTWKKYTCSFKISGRIWKEAEAPVMGGYVGGGDHVIILH